MGKKVFAFDMGKTSIGFCVREALEIKEANSIIIDKEHSDISSIRERRRVKKNLEAHKAREAFFINLWKSCGLIPLDTKDENFKKEFATKHEDVIYTSCLLRIALLQNKKLEQWQIFKALYNAIQRRGYDTNLAWKSAQSDDDKENQELVKKYTQENGIEMIQNEEYKYPCYYDAKRLGLWNETTPKVCKRTLNNENLIKIRTTTYVAPRQLIEKELCNLWKNAQAQIPELNKYTVEEFLYGEYKEPYGSFVNPKFKQYMGTNHDWQGVLGQKIPRFDNRIIAKCKLLPKRNVCKANTIENVSLVLLMKLKNLRLTILDGSKRILAPAEIKHIYENWLSKVEQNVIKMQEKCKKENKTPDKEDKKLDTTITKKEIENVINQVISDKIEPLKANISGRSAFCKRACQIINKFILGGYLYPNEMDITEFIDSENRPNGITKAEIQNMLSKIGDWNNLFIPDNRGETIDNSENIRVKTDLMIGGITNPIVRNRLQIFRDLLLSLERDYGKPDEVIFEFVREGADNSLFGKAKAQAAETNMREMEKRNQQLIEELKNYDAYSSKNFEKLKLLKIQCGQCAYSGEKIGIGDFNKCEIDHIYPRAMGGNDALYNKVLCYRVENQKKQDRTPYEWLSSNKEQWANYVFRLNKIKQSLGKKKFELLTSKPEDCAKLIDSYNGLAETAYIARVAQQITAFCFGWGLQVEGEKRHIFVNNGSSTHAIRRRYGLNSLLGNDIKKNRDNDKHHALDAICISFSRDFKYDEKSKVDVIDGFTKEMVKKVLDEIIPYPYTNKKPFKGNIRPLETIYGLRTYGNNSYITQRIPLESIEQKDKKIKTIIDEAIKNDLLEKLTQKMDSKDWIKMLQNYVHPTKKTKVKKVMVVVSEGKIEKDSNGKERIGEFCDFGTKGTNHQFKHSKGHKGQILYFNEKGSVKVMPIYANIKTQDVKDKLLALGCKLYNKGEMFYSGCLIEVEKPFNATVYYKETDENGKDKTISVKQEVPAGIFKLRTIMSNGAIKLENNCGMEILSSAKVLVEANMKKYKN